MPQDYVVLARKYRPQSFAELVGQDHVARTLRNALKSNRIGHAYIFAGGRGVGKTTTARILAKALNCAEGPAVEPCNSCPSCLEINQGSSLDVMEIDGASNRGIDEVRQLRENVKFAPSRSRFKIYIIDEVHMLTEPAFNALLKTIEEPPPHVKFILATTAADKIPETIQSRCQRFDFRLLTRAEITAHLEAIVAKEGYGFNKRDLTAVARAAEGSLRDAESLLEQVVAFGGENPEETAVEEVLHLVRGQVLGEFLKAVASRDVAAALGVIDQLAERGFDMRRFHLELLEWIRGLVLARISPELIGLVPLVEEDKKVLGELAASFSKGRLMAALRIAMEGERELKNTAVPRYAMELIALRLAHTEDSDTLEELTRRLEKLAAVPGGAPPVGQKTRPSVEATGNAAPAAKSVAPSTKAPSPAAGDNDSGADFALVEESYDQPAGDDWSRFLDGIKKRKIALGSFLEHGRLLGRDSRSLEIGFRKNKAFFYESAMEREHQVILQEVAGAVFGESTRVRLTLLDEEVDPAGEEAPKATDLSKKKKREALRNPLVQEIIDSLGGRVVDVKIL